MPRKPVHKVRLTPQLPIAQLGWIGIKAVFSLALLFIMIGGLVWLGGRAGKSVSGRDRYTVAFAAVQCDVPPGTDRPTFLGEVRYLGNLPEKIQSVDPSLPAKLTAAFAKHPWVAAVTGVTVDSNGTVSVGLTFRRPVLAVNARGGPPRLVDGSGILLPVAPIPPGVAALAGEWIPPSVSPGAVWPDPTVTRAAALAVAYKPASIQRLPTGGWKLVLPDGKGLTVNW
ncbi:MAG TPA: hypothetical protein VGJ05_10175 [Fimbriiglobus sp.]|jgi:hypothetical protein